MDNKIKVYFAILNHGWIRREIVQDLIPSFKDMEDVSVTLENLTKTWDHPISSNRNQIVQRFLDTDCDYLMMLDDDVVPLGNPLWYVYADKDVIGFPAKVRQIGRQLNWVAYVKDRGQYLPVNMDRVPDDIELLKVDAIGTGCILIKRKVLESIKAPFHIRFNEDGILMMGTDFAFSERASEAGFEIFTTPKFVCEHFKELGMLDMQSYNDSDGVDSAAIKYDMQWGNFAISPIDWEFIKRIILDTKPKKIIEFGSGLSSLLMAEYTKVESWEKNLEYAETIRAKSINDNLTVMDWKEDSKIDMSGCDLVFIDGPVGKLNGGPGRESSFKAAKGCKAVIVHDAGRDDEQMLQKKYLSSNYKLIKKNGWHQSRTAYWEVL